MPRTPTRAFAALTLGLLVVGATSITTRAHADDTPCSGCRDDQVHPEMMHVELGFERMSMNAGGSDFSSRGFPTHTGSELGFVTPTANLFDVRMTLFAGRGIGFVSDTAIGWAESDAAATDPYAQHVKGSMVVAQIGFGIEGLVPLGGGVQIRAAATTGPQFMTIPLDTTSSSGRSNALGAFQWFIRPRVALEVPIADHVMLGAFVTNDLMRVRSWGGGGYVGYVF
jgi:hypothetical protein